MAAFFAINLDNFPVNENGKLPIPFVLKYMRKNLFSSSRLLIIILILGSEYLRGFIHTLHCRSVPAGENLQLVEERKVGSGTHLDRSYRRDRPPHCFGMDKAIGIRREDCGDNRFGISGCHMWCWVRNTQSFNGEPRHRKY